MSFSIGIIGLPNVGKSTFFNCLSDKEVPALNYPFCTIEPSICNVIVEDSRLDQLTKISQSKKKVNTFVSFVDIAGLVKGASKGEGLGNKFLSNIKETDAICHVIRIFDDSKVINTQEIFNPLDDLEIINLELIESDKGIIKNRLAKISKLSRTGDKIYVMEEKILLKSLKLLDEDYFLSNVFWEEEENIFLQKMNLLTIKKMFFLLNKSTGSVNLDEGNDKKFQNLLDYFNKFNYDYLIIDLKSEYDLKSLSSIEAFEIRESFGGFKNSIDDVIKKGYSVLNLITFFTTGPEESRAWTIKDGDKAPRAASKIHTDFEKQFIRVEIIKFKDYLFFKNKNKVKEAGLLKIEGKEYIVKDADVLEFKI